MNLIFSNQLWSENIALTFEKGLFKKLKVVENFCEVCFHNFFFLFRGSNHCQCKSVRKELWEDRRCQNGEFFIRTLLALKEKTTFSLHQRHFLWKKHYTRFSFITLVWSTYLFQIKIFENRKKYLLKLFHLIFYLIIRSVELECTLTMKHKLY